MKTSPTIILIAIFTTVVSCVKSETDMTNNTEQRQEKQSANIVPGMLNILLSDDAAAMIDSGEDPCTVFASLNPISVERLFPYDSVYEKRQRAEGLHKWYTVFFNENVPCTKAAVIASDIPGVIEVERIARPQPTAIPFNDTYAVSRQWYLENTGTMLNGFKKNADINVVSVWNEYTAGSSDVIVGVIDSGVQHDHPDLNGVIIPKSENGSRSFFVSNISHPYEYSTIDNHGTHVAGTIAAINNNGLGVCGIAGGKDGTGGVRILDCQAIGESSYVSQAIQWAANHGAVIINNSWNGSYDKEADVPATTPSSYASAIDYFIKYAGTDTDGKQTGPMKGGLVVFSAGNNSWTRSQPAMYDKVIAVGATGPSCEAASYTNYGPWVDICAPGGNHNAYGNELAQIYSTKAGSTYGALQGTSMACPMVSGVAALLVSYYGRPGFTCDDLKEMLLSGADYETVANHTRQIGPYLDAYGSFNSKVVEILPVQELYAVPDKKSVMVIVRIQGYDGAPVYAYLAAISEDKSKLENLNPFNIPEGVITQTISSSAYPIGGRASKTFNNLTPGDYYCTAVAYLKNHQYSKNNNIIEFTVTGNRAPVITPSSIEPFTILHNQKDTLDIIFSDPDGDKLDFWVERNTNAAKWTKNGNNALKLLLNGSADVPGTYMAKLTVTDVEGLSTELPISFSIESNFPPSVFYEYYGKTELTHNDFISVPFEFNDPDDSELIVLTEAGSPAATWSQIGEGLLRLDIDGAKAPAGKYIASVKVSDTGGMSAEANFNYSILDNRAPIISTSTNGPISLEFRGSTEITVNISDPDGDQLTVQTFAGSQHAKWIKISNTQYKLQISGNSTETASYSASIEISDSYGGEANMHWDYTLKGNTPPYVKSQIQDLVMEASNTYILNLEHIFDDQDGDALVYDVHSNGNAKIVISGTNLTIETGNSPDISVITINATDTMSDPVQTSFKVRAYVNTIADIFPTRISDKLHIGLKKEGSASVKIVNSTGKTIINKDVTLSPFEFYDVDMSRYAPGAYTVSIISSNDILSTKIIKL